MTEVSAITGFPEIMDGRVKTLHPKIYGGLLGVLANKEHRDAQEKHSIAPIGLLVVNLYPFEETVAKGAGWDDTIENIDVGGPAMICAAAKNHHDVTVIVDPADYKQVMGELEVGGNRTSQSLPPKPCREGIFSHGELRRRDQSMVRYANRRDLRNLLCDGRCKASNAALRRKSASVGVPLRRARQADRHYCG